MLNSGSISGGASGARAPLDFSKGTTGTALIEPRGSMAWEGLGTTQFEMLPEPLSKQWMILNSWERTEFLIQDLLVLGKSGACFNLNR